MVDPPASRPLPGCGASATAIFDHEQIGEALTGELDRGAAEHRLVVTKFL